MPRYVGHYEVVRVIATGGMGSVFEARHQQSQQKVAVKLMRAGIPSAAGEHRFLREARILARLRHPGIAQIYDAGTFQDGALTVPFFAMEYLDGAKPLTDFADSKQLDVDERLRLFAQVCDAVHHGHENGVIHRDLKPENILVEADGRAKIIDFGVARATDRELELSTLLTDEGQLVGTVRYMSPEQTELDSRLLDRRSDVYSLGVVLYQLLCGRLPHELRDDQPPIEVMRVIKEEPPARISTVDERFRGDIETIVHKALEKERDRRYLTARDLADDVRRYLQRQPISARPPSLAYQVGAFARRNRVVVLAASSVMLAAIAAAIVSTVFAVEARHERDRALAAEERAHAVSEFLTSVIRSADPFEPLATSRLAQTDGNEVPYAASSGSPASVVDLLRRAVDRLDRDRSLDPLVEAELRATIGTTLTTNGSPEEGEEQIRRAILLRRQSQGSPHPDTLATEFKLSLVYIHQGRFAEMVPLCRDLHQRAARSLGPAHEQTLRYAEQLAWSLNQLGRDQERLALLRETTEAAFRIRGRDDPVALSHSIQLARVLADRGREAEALQLARSARIGIGAALGTESVAYAEASRDLGRVLQRLGHYAEAVEPLRTALRLTYELYGENHPSTVLLRENLAASLDAFGRVDEALELNEGGLKLCYRFFGEEHPWTLRMENSVAWNLTSLGHDLDRAEKLARHALVGGLRGAGTETTRTMDYRDTLGAILQRRGRYDEAEALLQRNVELAATLVDPGDWYAVIYERALASCQLAAGRYADAEQHLLSCWDRVDGTIGAASEPATEVMKDLITLYTKWDRPKQAQLWQARLAGAASASGTRLAGSLP